MRVEAKKHGQIFNYFINQGVQIMTKDMTLGSPLRMILLFSVPVLLGNIFQQFYNMVDTIIVGQYLGEDALAAVGSTGCLMFLVLGFANGIKALCRTLPDTDCHCIVTSDYPYGGSFQTVSYFNENTGQYLRTRRLLY